MSTAVASPAPPAAFSPLETWLATLACMVAFFTALFTASMVNVAVPAVMGSFGVGQSQAQLLLSAFFAMNSTGLLASSWMVARFGQRQVFLGALLTFGAAGLLCFTAPSFEILVLGRVTQGLAAGLLQPLIMLVLVQVFPPEKRGLAMGINEFAGYLAVAAAAYFTAQYADDFGLRQLPYVIGLAAIAGRLPVT